MQKKDHEFVDLQTRKIGRVLKAIEHKIEKEQESIVDLGDSFAHSTQLQQNHTKRMVQLLEYSARIMKAEHENLNKTAAKAGVASDGEIEKISSSLTQMIQEISAEKEQLSQMLKMQKIQANIAVKQNDTLSSINSLIGQQQGDISKIKDSVSTSSPQVLNILDKMHNLESLLKEQTQNQQQLQKENQQLAKLNNENTKKLGVQAAKNYKQIQGTLESIKGS